MVEEHLLNYAIEVRGCPRGEILGSDGKVRIFSVKYIKGLEFEGVFFVGIDKIAERHPEVVDKYLYVGLTRAASFLAVTASESFPASIREVQPYFDVGTWAL
jgi:superfamily I DNA/RNA helicase